MQVSFTPAEILAIAEPRETRGSTLEVIRRVSALSLGTAGDLTFLGNAKYKAEVADTRASIVLLPKDYVGHPVENQLFVLVENPSLVLSRICGRIEQRLWPKPLPGIHSTALVDSKAKIAASATIGPFCIVEAGAEIGERTHLQAQVFIGRETKIGDDCWIMPGGVIEAECTLQNRVRLQPGVVIGSDGFGYEFVGGRHEKVPQIGTVIVEDDVEIGSNTTIDRARFSRTVIGAGTKIDNLVQIGHNVLIGKHCLLCAQVGIAGSATIHDFVVMGGQAAAGGHITIGKGVKAGGQAGIGSDVAAGTFVNGTPAIPFMLERRIAVLKNRLPDLFKRVDALEEQLKKSSS
ncbi:MAG: UDP-3-O-(3-hydroxymyristoyl)glucosamine N-acyltransferase [Opitutus sp.]